MTSVDYRSELAKAGANIDSRWAKLRFLARRYPLGAAGAAIMAVCVFAAVFANYITVYDPLSTNAALSLARPSAQHWLGCDFMGRDVYSRIVYGARISLMVGIGSLGLGLTCGVIIGLTSGYLGGWVDLAVQRLIDILQSLPLLVMALLMTASLGPSLRNTIIAISIALVPSSARVVRASTLSLREQPFVESAKAIGPIAFADSTKGCSRRESVLARTTRAEEGTRAIEIAMIVFRSEGPSEAVINNAMTSNGSDCRMSIRRCTARSTQPPR